jgi:hypothetical protein
MEAPSETNSKKVCLDHEAIKKILKTRNTKKITQITPYLDGYVCKDGIVDYEAIEIILKTQKAVAIKSIKKYLNGYVYREDGVDYESFEMVLRSQCAAGIESVTQLDACIEEYLFFKENDIDSAYATILNSRSAQAIKCILPHLDQYIKKDGFLDPIAFKSVLSSKNNDAIEKILPDLHDYVVPRDSLGEIDLDRVGHVVNSYKIDAVQALYERGYLVKYVKTYPECISEIKSKSIQEILQQALDTPNYFQSTSLSTSRADVSFEAPSPLSHILLQTDWEDSLPQLTADEVAQLCEDRVSGSTLFSNVIQDVSEQSENAEEFILRG